MDKLIASASVGLAKAGMNRRGFLGKLAGATGGAAVLAGLLAKGAKASNCDYSHPHCQGPCEEEYDGACGAPCHYTKRNKWRKCYLIDCYTGDTCSSYLEHRGCKSCL